jgi:aspartate/tyrosine/aromatic aminotransferase
MGASPDVSALFMNAPFAPSLLSGVELAPRDPILGVSEAFNADQNPRKVNLGVGVYYDEDGKVPLLECVKRAERELTELARRAPISDRRHSSL